MSDHRFVIELGEQCVSQMSQNVPECPIGGESSFVTGTTLTERQLHAVDLILSGHGLAAVATRAGVDRRTLYRWRQDGDFQHELARRRREVMDDAADRLRALIHPSIEVLADQLTDSYDAARFRAATAILRLSDVRKTLRAGEEEDEEER